jgi:hypothetical protein
VDRKRLRYGRHRSQVGDLWKPLGTGARVAVVVLIHGGFWRRLVNKQFMNALAADGLETRADSGRALSDRRSRVHHAPRVPCR